MEWEFHPVARNGFGLNKQLGGSMLREKAHFSGIGAEASA
jgi:hypothetical protein